MNKQVNYFAKVIPLDKNGNPITNPINSTEYKIKDIEKKKSNPMAKIYITIILILLITLGVIVYLYIIPLIK